jgi:hypothetical protein
MTERDDLDELAKRGRKARASDARAAEAAATRTNTVLLSTQRRLLGRGATRLGILSSAGFIITVSVLVGLACVFLPAWGIVPRALFERWWPFVVGGVVFLLTALYIVGTVAGRLSVARELAWLDSLPFEVDGYPALFNDQFLYHLHFRCQLVPQASQPSLERLADIARSLHESSLETSDVRVDDATHFRISFNRKIEDNSQAARWLSRRVRRVISEVLVPLHAAHGISRIELSR